MKNIWSKYGVAVAITVVAMGFTNIAKAQYVWLDEKGVKQFSDQPPPPSVPKKRILKAPGARPVIEATASEGAPAEGSDQAATAPAASNKQPMTTAERNADFQKRKLEQAEKDKKSAEENANKAERAKNCEHSRDYQRSLDSGIRITQTDKNGERAIMTDEQRAKALQDTKRVIEKDCK